MAFYRAHVLICGGTSCVLKGSKAVKSALMHELASRNLTDEIKVVETGCLGPCDDGPVIVIYPEGTMYCKLTVGDACEIVEEHLLKGRIVDRLLKEQPIEESDFVSYDAANHYLGVQERIVLRNCGVISPESIEEYIARDGYAALGRCLIEMQPKEVIDVIKASGLRGRGGAGFPTGRKLEFTYGANSDTKYVICNADEGEPGTFKDRLILEGDPHSIIEGMTIAGYSVGASKGYVYIRGEYFQSSERINRAIDQAKEYGFLGHDIFGSGFRFDIEVREGAGAYICGEETALIESIEGKRGEPRIKPPYPPVEGLWGKPTVVNNVETLANIAPIILNGAEWFRGFGTEKCPGTKVYTLVGDINNKGLIEVHMGITLREIVYEIGGGIPGGREFKMAQTGGTSGGCIPAELMDVPMDYDSLAEVGTALGSGAMLIIDDSHDIVDVVKCFMKFFKHESCGKCTPCREGTDRLYEIMCRLSECEGTLCDIDNLKSLSRVMRVACLCGLGQAAPNPLVTTLKYFEDEYMAHVEAR
jgi:NADH:ubiquinone oxidoreductase subunit F (NADH-binding)/(2Fe-2S) ferredoxin